MAENQEQIESQLCGYVDDTLDPVQRAEIEAHLHAHPQHRRLLAELRLMRDAVRALPRESAPTELSESFSGQLERSVLLDGIGDQPMPTRMRINRLPQLAAVAAILLLAGGLGLVVYFVMLPGAKSPPQQAQNIPAAAPAIPGASGGPATAADGAGDAQTDHFSNSLKSHGAGPAGPDRTQFAAAVPAAPADDRAGESSFFKVPAPPAAGSLELANSNAKADSQLTSIANSVLTNQQVKALLGQAEQSQQIGGGGNRPTVVMVVSTANPDATTRQLGNYLQTNNADWQPAPSADELAQGKQSTLGNGASPRDFGAGDAAAKVNVEGARTSGSPAEKEIVIPATMPQSQPAASDFAYARPPIHDAPEAGAAADLDQRAQRGGIDSKSGNLITNAMKAQQNQLANVQSRCYVVHNLSFQQATQISDMLRQTGGNTQAPLFADKSADDSAKPGSYREPFQKTKTLAPDDRGISATTQPATQPQHEQMADANAIGHRMNIPGELQKDNADGSRPQTNPAAIPPPAASTVVPINNQTLLGSSPVDLVILIKDASPPTTLPATVPSTEPATQPVN